MLDNTTRITLLAGTTANLQGMQSAINKQPLTSPILCNRTGLAYDEQTETRFHGGKERALHWYPAEHYDFWKIYWHAMALPQSAAPFEPGAFGENISGRGWTEDQVCIGDIFQMGEVTVQISQPRSPCYKLNNRFGYPVMSQIMQSNGRCGWLLRVLEPGRVIPKEDMTLLERPCPELSVKRTADILFNSAFHRDNLELLANNDLLSPNWRRYALDWLLTGQPDDWSRRLTGNTEE